MIKIVITGPESTGKSTLATQLARHFNVPMVEEFARTFIGALHRPYTESDLLHIAKGQIALEETTLQKDIPLLICDSDLLTIKIWSEYKYGHCDPQILQWIKEREYDHYFLCSPDIPWIYDPQRENPNDRDQLFEIYKKELEAYNKSFTKLIGASDFRLKKAIERIEDFQKSL